MPKRKKENFDKRGYSLSPQDVSKHFWYYEEPKGLCCIFQPRDAGGKLLFHWPAFRIPWRVLDKTMKRRQAHLKRLARR